MNYIEVTGGTTSQRSKVQSMIEFCIKTLMPRMQTLEITVKLCTPEAKAMGYCLELDTKREFEIKADCKLKLRKLLETIAHEMVHVKQYELGELTQTNEEGMDYWDKPSEIEATGREPGLFIRWAEQNNIAHKKWTQT